jgi:hypothetical protein
MNMPKMTVADVSAADSYADDLIEKRGWKHDQALEHGLELATAAEQDQYPEQWNHDWPLIQAQGYTGDKRMFTALVAITLLERAPMLNEA